MATTIKLKNSVTTTNAPSSLVQGEVAINITDKKVWVGNAATTPIQLLGDGGSASFTSIAFGAGTVSSPSITFTGDTNTGIYSPAADTIAFTEGGVESMRINSSGNVGIGTSSPTARLTVVTSANNEGVIRVSDNATYYGELSRINATDEVRLGSYGASQNLTFYTVSSERMRIDSSGNVSIGTSTGNPLGNGGTVTTLAVASSGAGALSLVSSATADGSVVGALNFGTTGASTNKTTAAINGYLEGSGATNASGNLRFFTRSGTDFLERMRITSGGDVLVGTTTSGLYNQNTVNGINLIPGTSSNIQVSTDPAGSTGNACVLLNMRNTPVNGAKYVRFFYNGTADIGNISLNGTNAVAYNTSSDYRLKENIAPMTGALDKVAQLKPVTYTWKADGSAGQGFIAHELQEVVPDCVTGEKDAVETYTDEEGNEQTRPIYQGVDTSFLVATLTAAIQEQQAMIEELKQEVAKLKGAK